MVEGMVEGRVWRTGEEMLEANMDGWLKGGFGVEEKRCGRHIWMDG